jgi:hypothetical protein
MAVTALAPVRINPPSFASLPSIVPGRSILWSIICHACIVDIIIWLPIVVPAPTLRNPADLFRDSVYEPITYPGLPAIPAAGSGSGSAGGSATAPGRAGAGRSAMRQRGSQAPAIRPKAVYAGLQEIVSNLPNATNTVQTIRRPDMLTAPQLKYPIRLQSMVILPAPSAPVLVAPPKPQPQPKAAEPTIATDATVEKPVLVVRNPHRLSVAVTEAPKLPAAKKATPALNLAVKHSIPVLSPEARDSAPKAIIVLNAVTVPPNLLAAVPDAEVAGSFAVTTAKNSIPGKDATTTAGGGDGGEGKGTASGSGSGVSGTGATGAGGNGAGGSGGSNGSAGNGAAGSGSGGGGTGNGGGAGSGGAAGTGTGIGSGSGSGPGHGKGPGTGSGLGSGPGNGGGAGSGSGKVPGPGSGSLPGISISGGSPSRGGRAISSAPMLRGSYGLTIMSGGTSGGASRDVGIFGRDETVYTVYISMADTGGGPDWPMQYALVGSAPAGNGLLSPPFAIKKLHAAGPKDERAAVSGQVFVTGMVDEAGKLRGLRSLHPMDARSQVVINALEQWEFLPAQIDGKPVAVKVLIGATVIPARELEKKN